MRKYVGFWEAQAIFIAQLEEAGKDIEKRKRERKNEKAKERQEHWIRTKERISSCFGAEKKGIFNVII